MYLSKGTYTHLEALIWPWVRVRKADYGPGAGEESPFWAGYGMVEGVRVRFAFNFYFILFYSRHKARGERYGMVVWYGELGEVNISLIKFRVSVRTLHLPGGGSLHSVMVWYGRCL